MDAINIHLSFTGQTHSVSHQNNDLSTVQLITHSRDTAKKLRRGPQAKQFAQRVGGAYRYDVIPPVMHPEQLRRDDPEHVFALVLGQGLVAPECWHDIFHGLSEVPVAKLR